MKTSSKGILSKPSLGVSLLVGLTLWLTIPAQAALIDQGLFDDGEGGMMHLIYDDHLNITWLGDANFGAGSAFDDVTQFGGTTTDGAMSWQSAVNWAASLTVGGFTDWRLPTTTQPDANCSIQNAGLGFGTGCTGSEMGHLFNVEGISSGSQSPFTNVQPAAPFGFYWSGTSRAADNAWYFRFSDGFQSSDAKTSGWSAWAVRSGDVANPVPEPSTMLLMGSGLLVMILYVWRRERVQQT